MSKGKIKFSNSKRLGVKETLPNKLFEITFGCMIILHV